MKRLTVAVVAAALLFALSGAPVRSQKPGAKPAAAPPGNVDNGKQLFASSDCGTCHGTLAKGISGLGPQVTPSAFAIPEFVNYVRHPSGTMRPFSSQDLSDSQLVDIYAYLQSLSPSSKSNSSAVGVPAGNAVNGKRLYAADGCYECHGYAGQGGAGTGPKVGPHPISFSAFVAQLRHPSAEMPPYTDKVVSDTDLADIYAFMVSLPDPPKGESIPILNPLLK
jgi:mono/diheme cytochrome c family protein